MDRSTRKNPSLLDTTPPRAKAKSSDSSQTMLEKINSKIDRLCSQQEEFKDELDGIRGLLDQRMKEMENKMKELSTNEEYSIKV